VTEPKRGKLVVKNPDTAKSGQVRRMAIDSLI
jgi:hypothetical protein